MKYARTIDDSFPIAYERDKPKFDAPIMFWDGTIVHLQDDDVVCLGHPRCLSFNMRRQHIIKEADSVEELCDKFRYVSKVSSYWRIYFTLEQLIKSEYGINLEICNVFGCIDTDKGLVNVIKMKDEGGWELL